MTQKNIDRKEALKTLGKYAGMTALGTFLILNPKTAQACSSPPCKGGNGKGNGNNNGNGNSNGFWQ